jgi:rSAM/selenodomain-associated transferase 2
MRTFRSILRSPLSLTRLVRVKRLEERPRLSIGIVTPVYNEAAILEDALERLRRVLRDESVVVVDGGSTDGSAQIPSRFFPTEVTEQRGRALQMNRGAELLSSDVLLFLHADTRLPPGFQDAVRKALGDPRVVGGCFRLSFDSPRPMLRFIAWFTQFPGRFFHFGDQAFFVRRKTFEEMGGYTPLPFLEDVDFLRRLRRRGRFAVLPVAVITSARRFVRHGIVRQQLWNTVLVALNELGIPADRLARLYPHVR